DRHRRGRRTCPGRRVRAPVGDELRGGPMAAMLFTGAAEVVTGESTGPEGIRSGVAVAVRDGAIAAVAPEADLERRFPDAQRVDCSGCIITPGFVDSHTHAVFGRWRADEYALRARGVPYMEIARRGGGIL